MDAGESRLKMARPTGDFGWPAQAASRERRAGELGGVIEEGSGMVVVVFEAVGDSIMREGKIMKDRPRRVQDAADLRHGGNGHDLQDLQDLRWGRES